MTQQKPLSKHQEGGLHTPLQHLYVGTCIYTFNEENKIEIDRQHHLLSLLLQLQPSIFYSRK